MAIQTSLVDRELNCADTSVKQHHWSIITLQVRKAIIKVVHEDSDHEQDPKTMFVMQVMENKYKIYLHKRMLTAQQESDFTRGHHLRLHYCREHQRQ